jgi:hypothetical protein
MTVVFWDRGKTWEFGKGLKPMGNLFEAPGCVVIFYQETVHLVTNVSMPNRQ